MTDDAHDAWQRILGRLRTAVAGEFEILREIGSGGMAAVYLARELALHRLVAIKVMSPALLTGNGMVERFRQEARTIAGLDHRNIITIYAVRDYEDLHFFVMKFIKGRSLEHIIRTAGPLPIPMVRGLLYMVGDGLGHAHRRNVVHRDVKPANILIDADGNAIVTDFGIAKAAEAQASTHSAIIIGTPKYMSPEQCYARVATAASDQYSLGVVAYEMITGRPPFTGSEFVVMEAHTKVPPPPMRELRRDCPPELEAAVMRMLAKEPSDRWPSLHHALAELGAATLLEGHPVRRQIARFGLPEGEEDGAPEVVPKPYVSSLAILAPPDWVEAGDELTLRASARNWSGDTMPGIAIKWGTSEASVATIDDTGTVRALTPGVVSITASFEDKQSSVKLQVVPRRVATIVVSTPPGPIHVGDRVQLAVRLEDKTHKELKRPIAWMMSHPNVAAISDGGVLRALSPGLGLAFAEAEGIRGSAEIRIAPARVMAVRPTTAPASLVIGDRVSLGAAALDSLENVLDDRLVTWSSNAPSVATITPDGLVTAKGLGAVDFTCSSEGKSAVVSLRVEEPPVVTGDQPIDGSGSRDDGSGDFGDDSDANSAERTPAIATGSAASGALSVMASDAQSELARDSAADEATFGSIDSSPPATRVGAGFENPSLEDAKTPVVLDPRPDGTRRQRRRRDMALGGAVVLALIFAVSVMSGVGRGPNVDSARAADSAAAARVVARADSIRADSIAKAVSDSMERARAAPANVEITTLTDEVRVGEPTVFRAVVRDAEDKELQDSVRWESSETKIASIDSITGQVRGNASGSVTIRARLGQLEDHRTILVRNGRSDSSPRPPRDTIRRSSVDSAVRAPRVRATTGSDAPCQNLGRDLGAVMNGLVGDIKWRRFSALSGRLQPGFEQHLKDVFRTVPSNLELYVHCRDLVISPDSTKVNFTTEIEAQVVGNDPRASQSNKARRPLVEPMRMQAELARSKTGLRLTKIGPVQ